MSNNYLTDSSNLFLFGLMMIIGYFLGNMVHTNTSHLFFFSGALLSFYVLYLYREKTVWSKNEVHDLKIDSIIPRPKYINKYPDIVEFIHEIRHAYLIHPNAFYSFIKILDYFMHIYQKIINNEIIYTYKMSEMLNTMYAKMKNDLHTLVYNLSYDRDISFYFHDILNKFDHVMYPYRAALIKKANTNFNQNNTYSGSGYVHEYGPVAHNVYGQNTFDFF